MRNRDMIVIGASAGGVEALLSIARALPADLPASVFVVLHVPANSPSVLPRLLGRAGQLEAVHARDGEAIRRGVIYVAPPNCHLLVRQGHVGLSGGPRENGHRPAVDPLFRSAAAVYGSRVVGVVLSGNLDDGTAGLTAVKRRGGVAVVQHPEEALYAGMPRSAIEQVAVDHILPLAEIPALLSRLAREPVAESEVPMPDRMEEELDAVEMTRDAPSDDPTIGPPAGLTCPECHGSLYEISEGAVVRYRCRVGHAYSSETLLAEQIQYLETALWTALRALEENAALTRRMMERSLRYAHTERAERLGVQLRDVEHRAEQIRSVLRAGPVDPAALRDERTA